MLPLFTENSPLFNKERRRSAWYSTPAVEGPSNQQNLSIPSSYSLMDISKDKRFMAVIDTNNKLQVFGIECDENSIRPISHRIRDVPCGINSFKSMFTFLSVADETGYAVVSYAQMDPKTGLFLKNSFDSKFIHCTVYKETRGEQTRSTTIPLQGRAVFIEDKLAIVGDWTLEVLDAKTFRYKYFLDLSDLNQSYEAMIGAEKLGPNMSWADYFLVNQNFSNRKDGDTLIAITRHIRNNILVTTYRGNVTKVWSILDGSLIASFRTLKGEIIMAISEASQFIATYCNMTKRVKVYCAKSALLLHEYTPKCMEDDEGEHAAVHFVKFDRCKHYLLITGTKDNRVKTKPSSPPTSQLFPRNMRSISQLSQKRSRQQMNKPDIPVPTRQTLFFEVWSISQEKRIVYEEQEANVEPRMPLPFVIEDYHALEGLKDEDSYRYFDTDFYGVYMTRENDSNGSHLRLKRFPLLLKYTQKKCDKANKKSEKNKKGKQSEQDQNGEQRGQDKKDEPDEPDLTLSREGTLWKTYPFRRISNKSLRMRGYAEEMIQPLDAKEQTVSYLIKKGDDRFVLRFNLNMIQLWQLEEVEDPSKVDVNKKFDFTPEALEINQRDITDSERAAIQEQKEYEDRCIEAKKYYNSFEKSRLIYIRAYKGQHYLPLSTFREEWKLTQVKERRFQPHASIMNDKGRILVDIGYDKQTTKDEIFLRIPDSQSESICEPYGSTSTSSLTTIVDSGPPMVYHEIESFSQALHYLYFFLKTNKESPEVTRVGMVLFNKTRQLLTDHIFSKNAANYFSTVSGSKTLAMLASFPPGQSIIYEMTEPDARIPMKIFSYAVPHTTKSKRSENLLTVLIQETQYDLFQLLFNRVIIEYYKDGIANLSAFIDVLLCLQDEQSLARLLTCINNLSYLPVRFNKSALMRSEFDKMYADTSVDEDESSNLEYRGSFTALEQLNKYNYGFLRQYWTQMILSIRKYGRDKKSKQGNAKNKSKRARLCLVPLPYFNSYRIFPKEALMEDLTRHHKNSLFTRTALSDTENKIFRQGYTVMEVLVTYKWEAFARNRFIIILLLQVTYYVSFTIGVSLAEEIFGYVPGDPITHPGQIVSLVIALLLGLVLLFQEYRQWKVARWSYLKSFYNYLDLASFIFPLITFFLLQYNCAQLYEVSAISTLILWFHFILRLRVFRTVGYLLEMVIQLSAKIVPVTFVMILVVIAFTHSFFILLRKRNDLFIEEGSDGDGSDDNIFNNLFLAFITIWFFIFGVFDPLFDGELGTYPMALILAVVFSLIIVLILFNVVIALMSGKVEEISTTGTKCWIGHYASVVAEIELFWCVLSQRLSKNNNPIYVYYNANSETVEAHHHKMMTDTEKLRKKLAKRQNELSELSFDDDE